MITWFGFCFKRQKKSKKLQLFNFQHIVNDLFIQEKKEIKISLLNSNIEPGCPCIDLRNTKIYEILTIQNYKKTFVK